MVIISSIIAFIVANPAAIGLLTAALGALIKLVLNKLAKDKAAKYESNLLMAVSLAYDLVNDYAKTTPSKIDDKLALGLMFVRNALAPKKQDLSVADEQKARDLFRAMHGREVAGGDPHSVVQVQKAAK